MTDRVKVQVYGNNRPKFVWYPSVVQALESEGIMAIEFKEGGFVMTEACEGHFAMKVDRDTLRILGEELVEMANSEGHLEGGS